MPDVCLPPCSQEDLVRIMRKKGLMDNLSEEERNGIIDLILLTQRKPRIVVAEEDLHVAPPWPLGPLLSCFFALRGG